MFFLRDFFGACLLFVFTLGGLVFRGPLYSMCLKKKMNGRRDDVTTLPLQKKNKKKIHPVD